MFGSSIKLLLLISLYVSLAHGRHCETHNTCYEAKFTLHKESKIMICKSSYMHLRTFKNCDLLLFIADGTIFSNYRHEDDEELAAFVEFSPCDDIGDTTFDNGNTFEICLCHRNEPKNECNKMRLVKGPKKDR